MPTHLPKPIALLCCLSALSWTAGVHASPWTLPRGDIALVTGFSQRTATKEFFDDDKARNYPLKGKFSASDLFINARFGITDRWELELGLPLRQVSYEADPVSLLPGETFDEQQENVLDFSSTEVGLGDLRVAGRYALLKMPFPLALEVKVKSPTGYDKPSGTFGDRPRTADEFLAAVMSDPDTISPDRVTDDVTLGTGQLDVGAAILVGQGFSTGTFVRFDGGFNLRLGGAGDELQATLKGGQFITKQILLYGGAEVVYAVQDGRKIGVSVAAIDPDLPATDYDGLENLDLREVPLDRDSVEVGGGVILRVIEGGELNLGYSRTVWGRNTAQFDSFVMSVGMRFSTLPQPIKEALPQDGQQPDGELEGSGGGGGDAGGAVDVEVGQVQQEQPPVAASTQSGAPTQGGHSAPGEAGDGTDSAPFSETAPLPGAPSRSQQP